MSAIGSVVNLPESPVFSVEDWGYYLLPPSHPASPGASGLIVAIRAQPTCKHFDPEKILLRVSGMQGKPERVTLERKEAQALNPRVCFGNVTLVDRRNKSVEFFTFGGSIEVAQTAEETIYSLYSPAPLLQLLPDMESLQDQFVSEVEVLFSEAHAHWGAHDSEFDRHLATLNAETLYEAVLRDLWKKYPRCKGMQDTFPHLYKLLGREVEWMSLHSAWHEWGPSLEDLVGQP